MKLTFRNCDNKRLIIYVFFLFSTQVGLLQQ